MSDDARIESVLHENRLFPPPEGIAERLGGALVANLDQWQKQHEHALSDPSSYWGEVASAFWWAEPWTPSFKGRCPTPDGSTVGKPMFASIALIATWPMDTRRSWLGVGRGAHW